MTVHEYQEDRQSGAGNCTCGAAKNHMRHPHAFLKAARFPHCVCTQAADAPIHTEGTK